ncbi:MAG: hypothetical protein ACRDM1_07395 [Gaiellaceae bacterium]
MPHQRALRALACAAVLCLTALAAPAAASAHGRAATVALDYRLPLDPAGRRLQGIKASILDGDRDLRLVVRPGIRVVVLGDLGEPMLRVDDGVWVNRNSPTAQANRLVKRPEKGWKRVAGGREFAWHEHRLAPPPFEGSRYGPVAHWQVPLLVNGRPTAVSGSFWRVPRPAAWPWGLGAAAAIAIVALAMLRLPRLRLTGTIGAGILAGLAGLTAQTAFSLRDAPSGHIGWALIGSGLGVAAIAAWLLAVSRGTHRAYIAGAIGVGVAAFCLSWLGVFFHGAVVSALPAQATRLVCAVAFTAGLISLVGAIWIEPPAEAGAR